MNTIDVWLSARQRLEKEVTKQQFTTWIQPLQAAQCQVHKLLLSMTPKR